MEETKQSNKPTLAWQKKELGKIKEEEPSSSKTKEEEASSSTGPAPLKKGDELGTVMVDFHNALEVHDEVPEKKTEGNLVTLEKGL